jgi:hypothetical protein
MNNKKNSKNVRFALEPTVFALVTARSELTTEEMNDTWWTHADMKEFFRSAMTLSKDAQRRDFMLAGVKHAYESSKYMASSQKGKTALQKRLENIQIDQNLLDWCRFGHSWRGLERASSVAHNEARTHIAQKARSVVFDMELDMDADVIGRAYERASRSSKVFARVMGEADAMVNPVRCCIKKHKSSSRPTYPRKRSRRTLMVCLAP